MADVQLNVVTSGSVTWVTKREIENTFRDCYRKFRIRLPYRVDVHIVDTEANVQTLLKEEKLRMGVTTSGDEEYICYHDAWRGYPRIICCLERLAALSKQAKLGALRHEAAHSALHGSLEYYIFKIPEECRHTIAVKGLDASVLEQVLYFVSVAVKDFEATRFLVQRGFIECQFAFALEWIRPSEEDKATWKAAQSNRRARFIYLAALLKPVLFAHPLLALPKSKKVPLEHQVLLARRVEEMLEYLGTAERNRFLQVANLMVEELSADTHKNVDIALQQAMNLA